MTLFTLTEFLFHSFSYSSINYLNGFVFQLNKESLKNLYFLFRRFLGLYKWDNLDIFVVMFTFLPENCVRFFPQSNLFCGLETFVTHDIN